MIGGGNSVQTATERPSRVFLARIGDFAGGDFPATLDELIARAKRRNTPSDVMAVLLRLNNREYGTLRELQAAVTDLLATPS
jgi:hypothetical protein